MTSLKEDKIKIKVKIMCVDVKMAEDDIIIVVVMVPREQYGFSKQSFKRQLSSLWHERALEEGMPSN